MFKMKHIKKLFLPTFFILFSFALVIGPPENLANAGILDQALKLAGDTNAEAKLGTGDLTVIIGSIIRYALGLLGTIFLVLILYGGFLWMTAGGNEEKIGKAKKMLANSTVGLLIVILSYAIALFIINVIRQAQLPPV